MKELERTSTHDVILLGDMNDALGSDEFEKDPASGGDAIANLVGPPEDGFMLATRKLAERNENSFHGYYNPRYRELIDHAVVSKSMWPRVKSVEIFHDGFTAVASDHFPVMIRLDAGKTWPRINTNEHE
jgi:endonuclease/exonuclease/phosphatase family metal-dependent hydrolase